MQSFNILFYLDREKKIVKKATTNSSKVNRRMGIIKTKIKLLENKNNVII